MIRLGLWLGLCASESYIADCWQGIPGDWLSVAGMRYRTKNVYEVVFVILEAVDLSSAHHSQSTTRVMPLPRSVPVVDQTVTTKPATPASPQLSLKFPSQLPVPMLVLGSPVPVPLAAGLPTTPNLSLSSAQPGLRGPHSSLIPQSPVQTTVEPSVSALSLLSDRQSTEKPAATSKLSLALDGPVSNPTLLSITRQLSLGSDRQPTDVNFPGVLSPAVLTSIIEASVVPRASGPWTSQPGVTMSGLQRSANVKSVSRVGSVLPPAVSERTSNPHGGFFADKTVGGVSGDQLGPESRTEAEEMTTEDCDPQPNDLSVDMTPKPAFTGDSASAEENMMIDGVPNEVGNGKTAAHGTASLTASLSTSQSFQAVSAHTVAEASLQHGVLQEPPKPEVTEASFEPALTEMATKPEISQAAFNPAVTATLGEPTNASTTISMADDFTGLLFCCYAKVSAL